MPAAGIRRGGRGGFLGRRGRRRVRRRVVRRIFRIIENHRPPRGLRRPPGVLLFSGRPRHLRFAPHNRADFAIAINGAGFRYPVPGLTRVTVRGVCAGCAADSTSGAESTGSIAGLAIAHLKPFFAIIHGIQTGENGGGYGAAKGNPGRPGRRGRGVSRATKRRAAIYAGPAGTGGGGAAAPAGRRPGGAPGRAAVSRGIQGWSRWSRSGAAGKRGAAAGWHRVGGLDGGGRIFPARIVLFFLDMAFQGIKRLVIRLRLAN